MVLRALAGNLTAHGSSMSTKWLTSGLSFLGRTRLALRVVTRKPSSSNLNSEVLRLEWLVNSLTQ